MKVVSKGFYSTPSKELLFLDKNVNKNETIHI